MRHAPRAALPAALAAVIARFERDLRGLTVALTRMIARYEHDLRGLTPLTDTQALPRAALVALLRDQGGNVTAVGRVLGKAPVQVRRWCLRYALDPAEFRGLTEAQRQHQRDQLRSLLAELLREHGGNVSAVGRALKKAPVQIRRWCRMFSMDAASFRAGAPQPTTPSAALRLRTRRWVARSESQVTRPRRPPEPGPHRDQFTALLRQHRGSRPRRDEFTALLRQHRGSVSAVARALGKDRKQIQRWCRVLDVEAAAFRSDR